MDNSIYQLVGIVALAASLCLFVVSIFVLADSGFPRWIRAIAIMIAVAFLVFLFYTSSQVDIIGC